MYSSKTQQPLSAIEQHMFLYPKNKTKFNPLMAQLDNAAKQMSKYNRDMRPTRYDGQFVPRIAATY